jgi:WD40 repeat protein
VALAWSADGRFLCVGQKNGGCQISEREQLGQVRVQLSGHSGPALGVGFAPVVYPHSVLATAATDGVLCLWSTDDEQKPFASETLPAKVRGVRGGLSAVDNSPLTAQ